MTGEAVRDPEPLTPIGCEFFSHPFYGAIIDTFRSVAAHRRYVDCMAAAYLTLSPEDQVSTVAFIDQRLAADIENETSSTDYKERVERLRIFLTYPELVVGVLESDSFDLGFDLQEDLEAIEVYDAAIAQFGDVEGGAVVDAYNRALLKRN